MNITSGKKKIIIIMAFVFILMINGFRCISTDNKT
jgi:hypothetical protein